MRLALLGDIALFGAFDIKNNPRLKENLREISSYLDGFDYVVGNLETPFSEKKKNTGQSLPTFALMCIIFKCLNGFA